MLQALGEHNSKSYICFELIQTGLSLIFTPSDTGEVVLGKLQY